MCNSIITIQQVTVTNKNSLKIAWVDGIFASMSLGFPLNRYDLSFFIKSAHRILSSGYAVIYAQIYWIRIVYFLLFSIVFVLFIYGQISYNDYVNNLTIFYLPERSVLFYENFILRHQEL